MSSFLYNEDMYRIIHGAQVKYGHENVFAAMMGGRSLRATGEAVYSSSCMDGSCSSAHAAVARRVCAAGDLFKPGHQQLFNAVGGQPAWQKLLQRVEAERRRVGRWGGA